MTVGTIFITILVLKSLVINDQSHPAHHSHPFDGMSTRRTTTHGARSCAL